MALSTKLTTPHPTPTEVLKKTTPLWLFGPEKVQWKVMLLRIMVTGLFGPRNVQNSITEDDIQV